MLNIKIGKLCGIALFLVVGAVQAGEKIDQTLTVSPTGQVNIDSLRGKATLIGWDKDTVEIRGELDDKAEGYDFTSENGITRFKVKMPKMSRHGNWDNDKGSILTIHLPVGSNLSFQSVNGDIVIENVSGGSQLTTVNGDIKATKLQGLVKLQTVNGDVNAADIEGKIKLMSVNGKLVDKGSKGKIHYETVNGDIDATSEATHVQVQNVNGEIKLNLPHVEDLDISTVSGETDAIVHLATDGQVNISTVSGDATIRFDGDIGGDFRLSSHAGGQIKNHLTDDKTTSKKYGPGGSLQFSKSGGNANVHMTSVSGNLILKQK